jgi:HAD superfamily hydrolase (TIGR01549 family)
MRARDHPPAATLQAVLFDMGDTLFERAGGSELLVDAARTLGAEVDRARAAAIWADVHARARTPEELAKGRDTSPAAHRACWTALYHPAEALVAGLAEEMYQREIGPQYWRPFPDALPTLRALHARGVPIGVVSDAGFDIRSFFRRHRIDGLISSFVISCEHGVTKPAARLFELACAGLGVTPAATLMVGDNPVTDGGAVDAGLTCLLLPPRPPGTPPAAPRGLGQALRLVG